MSRLTQYDWLVIIAYLGGIIWLGLRFGREQRTTKDYFLGGRNLPWWGVGLSIIATETSAMTFIGIPALAYGGNLLFIQIVFGYVVARLILAAYMVPHYFKGEIYSPYELISNAFGHPARRAAGGFFLISQTLAAGVRVYVTCIPLQLMLNIDILPAILLFVILSLAYTYVGGLKAVIWTDAVQFGIFMAGGLYALIFIPAHIEGGWAAAWKLAGEAGKLEWFNPKFSLGGAFNIWMGVVGAMFLTFSSHGVDQLIVQRVLACGDEKSGRKALILSGVLILPLFLIFLLTGTLLWVFYQHHPMGIPIPGAAGGIGQNDFVFPIFILTEVPQVMKGFLIVAILCAAMSSVSSALSALASVFTMDIVKELVRGKRDEAWLLGMSKLSTLFWAAMLVLVAWRSRESPYVLNLAFSLSGLTSGAMLAAVLLALWLRRGSASQVVAGMFMALATMILLSWQHKQSVAWPWYTLIGCAVAVSTTLLLRLAAPPKPINTNPA